MFITAILSFDISSLSSYALHFFFQVFIQVPFILLLLVISLNWRLTNIQYIVLLYTPKIMIYYFLFNNNNLILSKVFQWWYTFGWPYHVEFMYNVYKWYKWYKTHVSVLSLWAPTDYSTMLCKYILEHLLIYYHAYTWLALLHTYYNFCDMVRTINRITFVWRYNYNWQIS